MNKCIDMLVQDIQRTAAELNKCKGIKVTCRFEQHRACPWRTLIKVKVRDLSEAEDEQIVYSNKAMIGSATIGVLREIREDLKIMWAGVEDGVI